MADLYTQSRVRRNASNLDWTWFFLTEIFIYSSEKGFFAAAALETGWEYEIFSTNIQTVSSTSEEWSVGGSKLMFNQFFILLSRQQHHRSDGAICLFNLENWNGKKRARECSSWTNGMCVRQQRGWRIFVESWVTEIWIHSCMLLRLMPSGSGHVSSISFTREIEGLLRVDYCCVPFSTILEQWKKSHIQRLSESWQITIKNVSINLNWFFLLLLQQPVHTTQIIMEICGKHFIQPEICVWIGRTSWETWKWWKIYLNGKWIDSLTRNFFSLWSFFFS